MLRELLLCLPKITLHTSWESLIFSFMKKLIRKKFRIFLNLLGCIHWIYRSGQNYHEGCCWYKPQKSLIGTWRKITFGKFLIAFYAQIRWTVSARFNFNPENDRMTRSAKVAWLRFANFRLIINSRPECFQTFCTISSSVRAWTKLERRMRNKPLCAKNAENRQKTTNGDYYNKQKLCQSRD